MANLKSLIARRWPLLVVVALLALLGWQASQPTSVIVDVAVASRGGLRVTVDDDGRTRVVERYTVCAPIDGRRRQRADVAQPQQRHMQRARDGRRGESEYVDLRAQRQERLLVLDPEALLLVDHDQAKIRKDHVL